MRLQEALRVLKRPGPSPSFRVISMIGWTFERSSRPCAIIGCRHGLRRLVGHEKALALAVEAGGILKAHEADLGDDAVFRRDRPIPGDADAEASAGRRSPPRRVEQPMATARHHAPIRIDAEMAALV
jgi:hypothetical protein